MKEPRGESRERECVEEEKEKSEKLKKRTGNAGGRESKKTD